MEQANQLRADQAALCQYFAHINERIQRQGLSEHLYAAHFFAAEALLASRGPPLRGGGPLQEGVVATPGFVAPSDSRSPPAPLRTGAGEGNVASPGSERGSDPRVSVQCEEGGAAHRDLPLVDASVRAGVHCSDDGGLPSTVAGDQESFNAFDPSHRLHRTTNYVFCAVCCVYAKIRSVRVSCKLRVRCSGEAPSHNARRVRDRLMLGTEPGTPLVVTGSLAVRL